MVVVVALFVYQVLKVKANLVNGLRRRTGCTSVARGQGCTERHSLLDANTIS